MSAHLDRCPKHNRLVMSWTLVGVPRCQDCEREKHEAAKAELAASARRLASVDWLRVGRQEAITK